MAIQFTTTGQQASDGIKCGIYGRDGAGKTTLIPTASRPLVIDVEGKTLSIASANVPAVRVRTWADWLDMKNWLQNSANAAHFDTLFIDSISKLAEISLLEHKVKNKDARRAYQDHRDCISTAVGSLLTLPEKNVVFNAWSTLIDQPDGTKIYAPSMPGMSVEQALGYSLNELFFINIGTFPGPPTPAGAAATIQLRYLQTQQDVYAQARDNSRTLLAQEEPNLTKVFAKIKAGIPVA